MKAKNLPIKIILQRKEDIEKNLPGGKTKIFPGYSENKKKKL